MKTISPERDGPAGVSQSGRPCITKQLVGNQNVRIQKLENGIGTVYTSKYPGGLNSWLLAYENAFAELAELGYMAQ